MSLQVQWKPQYKVEKYLKVVGPESPLKKVDPKNKKTPDVSNYEARPDILLVDYLNQFSVQLAKLPKWMRAMNTVPMYRN